MSRGPPSVLFVCLGNICRSPLAEAAFRLEAERAGLAVEVDSAGTADWHAGKPPDPRSIAVARDAGIDISGQRARQVTRDDFRRFTHIFAIDTRNLADLRAIMPEDATAHLSLLLDVVGGHRGESVRDPYHEGEDMFAYTWTYVSLAARALAEKLLDECSSLGRTRVSDLGPDTVD